MKECTVCNDCKIIVDINTEHQTQNCPICKKELSTAKDTSFDYICDSCSSGSRIYHSNHKGTYTLYCTTCKKENRIYLSKVIKHSKKSSIYKKILLIGGSCLYGLFLASGSELEEVTEKSVGELFCKFDRKVPYEYVIKSAHAKCRMKCRLISNKTVERVYEYGKENCFKSEAEREIGCPRYALEGIELHNNKERKIRIIIADCALEPVLVTVINTSYRHEVCSCK